MVKQSLILCLSLLIFSCSNGRKKKPVASIDDLAELPAAIQSKLKKSKSGNIYIYDPPYAINEPIPVPHECIACTCESSAFVFVTANRIICMPFNAPENEGIKAVPFLSGNESLCGVKEYQFANQVNQISQRMYCFESSGPWGATLKRIGDCCTATITYELFFADQYVSWYNDIGSFPDGINIVGGTNNIDFSIPSCTNCGGSISDCNGNGFGDDNPWDFENGI